MSSLRTLRRRVDSIRMAAGLDVGPSCTCGSSHAKSQLAPLIQSQVDARGETVERVSISENTDPCQATIHHWQDGYRHPKMSIARAEAKASLVELLRSQGISEFSPMEPNITMTFTEHEEKRLEDNDGGLDHMDGKETPDDPLEVAIRARINKLRPGTVDPGADDADDPRWLRVGEEV